MTIVKRMFSAPNDMATLLRADAILVDKDEL